MSTVKKAENICHVQRPFKPDLEFRKCPIHMVSVGDTIIVPNRTIDGESTILGKVVSYNVYSEMLDTFVTLAVRIHTEKTGFAIEHVRDHTNKMKVWVLMP